jgi:hypothetical protein
MEKGIERGFGAVLVFCILAICACEITNTKVSKENYDKIRTDMTAEQVLQIMGKADTSTESETPGFGKMELWHYQLGMKAIDVTLFNGRVYDKTWTEL